MHPDKKTWHTLDYTIVNRKFRSSVEDARFLRKATSAIGTDHHLMRSKIKLHLKCRAKKVAQHKQLRLDQTKLADEAVLVRFQSEMEKILTESRGEEDSVDERYAKFVTHIKDTAQHQFQPDQNAQKRRKEWLTDEILHVIEKRSLSFLACQNQRGTSTETKARRKYVTLRKEAKRIVDSHQTEYWDEISREIEASMKQHDPATAYGMIRRLRGGKQRVESMPIHDKNGMRSLKSTDRLDRWKEYFQELLHLN